MQLIDTRKIFSFSFNRTIQVAATKDKSLVFQNKRLDHGLYWLVEESGHVLLFVSVCCAENHHSVLKDHDKKSI